jgi:transcriptional regulator with XRE-family HTH domain
MISHAPTAEGVAAEVRAEMGRQRKTQAELARALRMHPATVARRLDGSTPFDVAELVDLGAWLGVPAAALLARAEQVAAASEVA